MLTRRRFLLGASAVAAGGAGVGVGLSRAMNCSSKPVPIVPLGTQPAGLPAGQHAWGASLARDGHGNPISPLFDRLLFFDVDGTPSPAHAGVLEAGLRTLESTYRWGPGGLLFTAGWSPNSFEGLLGVHPPIPYAQALSDFELPAIDTYHL